MLRRGPVVAILSALVAMTLQGAHPLPARAAGPGTGWIVDVPSPTWCCGGTASVHLDASVEALLVDGPDPHLAVKLGTPTELANGTGFVARFYPPAGQDLALGTYTGAMTEDHSSATPRIGITTSSDACLVDPGWFRIDELETAGTAITSLAISSSCPLLQGQPLTLQIRLGSAVPFAPAVVEPAQTVFPRTHAATASDSQAVVFHAVGSVPLHVSAALLAGADAPDFEIVDDACTGATVAPGEVCAISVRFAPADGSALDRNASLEIHDDSLPGFHRGALYGTVERPTAITIQSAANPNPDPVSTKFYATVTPDPGFPAVVEWSVDGVAVSSLQAHDPFVVGGHVGTYAVTARFLGSTGYAPSAVSTPIQQVTLAATAVTIIPSPAVSGLTGAVDVTATVTVGGVDVSGTVSITDLTTGHALGSGPVTKAVPSLVVRDVPISGTHQIRADFDGVAPYVPPASSTVTVEGAVGSDPGAAGRVLVTGLPSAAIQGLAGSAILTVLDLRGRVVSGYTGTLHLGSSDTLATLPTDVTFTAADAGRRIVALTFHSTGTQTLTARDTVDARIAGHGSVTVTPPATDPIPAHAVSRGADHACAIDAAGGVRCWGQNPEGQVGDGTTIARLSPTVVPGITGATAVVAGVDHTCALLADHTIRCWGANDEGQLGDGTVVKRTLPVAVAGIDSAVGIEATASGTCALLAGGTVRCWGRGFAPGMDAVVTVPVTLPTVAGALSFGAGNTACYVDGDHAVWCWGLNTYGQLGDGTTTSSTVPVRVSGITTAVEVETGYSHTCARLLDGTLRCWGAGQNGELGDGAFVDRATPVVVDAITDAVDLVGSPMSAETCARLATGELRCWGGNNLGQLGDGTVIERGSPSTTILDQPAVDASIGSTGGCVVLAGGALRCWGSNTLGELGDGPRVRLAPTPTLPMQAASALALPGDATCALGTDAVVRCWGSRAAGEVGDGIGTGAARPVVISLSSVAQVAGTADHACARRTDGTVWCWGNGMQGQLGDGRLNVTGSPPVQVTGVTTAIDVAAGGGRTCAVLSGGTVWCWGAIAGTSSMTAVPAQVSGISTATRVVAGSRFVCALLADHTVTCWGSNSSGELGSVTADSPDPAAVPDLTGVTDLAARSDGTCALRSDHTVLCWGGSALGHAPVVGRAPVTGITTAVAIGAGSQHACAILQTGQVMCWGSNFKGQLGDGTIVDRTTPVAVPGVTAAAIDGGQYHTCALVAAGAVKCWGSDAVGQLGIGLRPFAPVAMPVDLRGIAPLAIALEMPAATNTLQVPISIVIRPGSPGAHRFRTDTSPRQPGMPASWSTTAPVTRQLGTSCGTCTIYAWAWNETGEVSAAASATVIVDAIRPTASLTAPATTSARTVPVTAGGTDDQSGIGAWLVAETPVNPAANDTRWRETPPTTFTVSNGDGLKRIYVWTRDLAWNVSPAGQANVRLDTTAPTGLGTPGLGVVWTGSAKGTLPARVTWTAARDPSPGGVTYAVAWQSSGSSTWHAVTLPNPQSAAAVLSLVPGTYRVRVRASDALGHATSWRTGAWFTLRRFEESASAIKLVKGFKRVTAAGASGGKVATARVAGSTLTASFTGTSVAWVGVRGPDRGSAKVYLDGKLIGTVNLYAVARIDATVVWRRSLGSAKAHVLKIVATGTHATGSTATWVDLDAVLVAR